jgi:hypothetical protein
MPQYPAQNSLRGFPPEERVRALLYHIKRQESRYHSRPANEGAVLRILIHALAVEVMNGASKLPCSAPSYLKTQVARAVYGLLHSDIRVLEKLYDDAASAPAKEVSKIAVDLVKTARLFLAPFQLAAALLNGLFENPVRRSP